MILLAAVLLTSEVDLLRDESVSLQNKYLHCLLNNIPENAKISSDSPRVFGKSALTSREEELATQALNACRLDRIRAIAAGLSMRAARPTTERATDMRNRVASDLDDLAAGRFRSVFMVGIDW